MRIHTYVGCQVTEFIGVFDLTLSDCHSDSSSKIHKMFRNTAYIFIVIVFLVLFDFAKSEGKGGLLADISPEQRNKLDQLRKKVVESGIKFHDYQKRDGYLIRWLTARRWDIELAVQSLVEAQEWRKNENIDSILNETLREVSFLHVSIDGVDYEGRPVMYTTIPDLRSLILQGKKDKSLRYQIQIIEQFELKLRELSETTGRDVDQGIAIHDYAAFNLRQTACRACVDVVMRGIRNLSNFYPRIFSAEVFINVPRSAEFIFNTLAEETRSRMRWTSNITVFGSNKAEWSTYLLKIIPTNQLKTQYGGIKQ